MAARLVAFLRERTLDGQQPRLTDVAYTLQRGREEMPERLAVVAGDMPQLCDLLERYQAGGETCVLRGRAAGADAAASATAPPEASTVDERGLTVLARHWVSGATVDWTQLEARQQGRLIGLPGYPF